MIQQFPHHPDDLEDPDDDARSHFEGSALHSLQASASDLAGIGYSLEALTEIIARVFEKPTPIEPTPSDGPVPF